MGHDPSFSALAETLDGRIEQMLEMQAARVVGYDDVQFDPHGQIVTYVRQRGVLWRGDAEPIGSYHAGVGVWRWWWHGVSKPAAPSRLNAAFAAGQSHGVPTLTSPHPLVRTEQDAIRIANVVAVLAKADGVYRTREPGRLSFYALYGAPNTRPPMEGADTSSQSADLGTTRDSLLPLEQPLPEVHPVRAPIMSMVAPSWLPSPEPPPGANGSQTPHGAAIDDDSEEATPRWRRVREPPRELVLPIVKLALAAVVQHLPDGFQQALVTIDLSGAGTTVRFNVQIVASDRQGALTDIPTPQGLMEATATMIAADAKQGNGRWRRVVARLVNRETGVSLHVGVRA